MHSQDNPKKVETGTDKGHEKAPKAKPIADPSPTVWDFNDDDDDDDEDQEVEYMRPPQPPQDVSRGRPQGAEAATIQPPRKTKDKDRVEQTPSQHSTVKKDPVKQTQHSTVKR